MSLGNSFGILSNTSHSLEPSCYLTKDIIPQKRAFKKISSSCSTKRKKERKKGKERKDDKKIKEREEK